MRKLLVILLIPMMTGISFGENPVKKDGRYQYVNTSSQDFLLDTKTGEIWQRISVINRTGAYFVSSLFIVKGGCVLSPESNEIFPCFQKEENPENK